MATRPSAIVLLTVTAVCLAHSAIRTPTPGVNEPHYLSKARHLFDAGWCPGDFFLDSSNPHLVFYLLAGPLAGFLPLAAVAWIGRALALTLLASGWATMVHRLVPGRWSPLLATAVFLAWASAGSLSGEWVVGGFESKVLAYAALTWSVAARLGGQPRGSAAWLGAAICVHPVVGGWAAVAAILANPWPWTGRRWVLASIAIAVALPGLLPALGLLGNGSTSADTIQVFGRLGHHLVPGRFSRLSALLHAAAVVTWLGTRRLSVEKDPHGWWTRVVLATSCVLVCGWFLALEQPPRGSGAENTIDIIDRLRLTAMKFYPYRLFDVVLPAAIGMRLCGLLAACSPRRISPSLAVLLLAIAWGLPAPDRNPSRMSFQEHADWLDTCQFINSHLPDDAVVLTPRNSWAFKWYANRAEYVVFKDCPQDASGILEWDRRRIRRGRWLNELQLGRPPVATTTNAFADTGVTHIVWRRADGLDRLGDQPPLFETPSFVVYLFEPESPDAISGRRRS